MLPAAHSFTDEILLSLWAIGVMEYVCPGRVDQIVEPISPLFRARKLGEPGLRKSWMGAGAARREHLLQCTNAGLIYYAAPSPSSPEPNQTKAGAENPQILRTALQGFSVVFFGNKLQAREGEERREIDGDAGPWRRRSSTAAACVEPFGPGALTRAAFDGNLGLLKGLVKSRTKGNDDPTAIFSFNKDDMNVLHVAACLGHLEVCKYLVEDLGGDVNAPSTSPEVLGATPFMISVHSGDVPTVKYLLDHGGDLMKADGKGRTVLHHAVGAGSCKVTEFLLSKGVPVDIDCGRGTAVHTAAFNEQDKTLKILLDHHANPNTLISGFLTPLHGALMYRSLKCMKLLIKAGADINGKGAVMTPLVFATAQGGYTNFIKFLLKAGADANIPDDMGMLPVELAAARNCREEVDMLFPLTSPIPNVQNWSVDGVIAHAKIEEKKPLDQRHLERRKNVIKSQADRSIKQKDYKAALKFYDLAMSMVETATLYANRSLCKLLMGDGEGALSDALRCRMLRPEWANACYRQATAHMLLKEYKQARDAFLDAQKLDPGNDDIERELRRATELMQNPRGGQ